MRSTVVEGVNITALGHAGFRLESEDKTVSWAYDPYDIGEVEPVDYIFISHNHYDHCDHTAIRKLLKDGTRIIAPKCSAEELSDFADRLNIVTDDDKHELGILKYWTVPAYNTNKFRTPSEVFHPKEVGGVGFVVEYNNKRFYHAGDTDNIPEMAEMKKITVAFLPISGTYVMTTEEAMKAAEAISPKVVIPMHFGKILGSVSEAIRFGQTLREKIPTTVLQNISLD